VATTFNEPSSPVEQSTRRLIRDDDGSGAAGMSCYCRTTGPGGAHSEIHVCLKVIRQ
jgi:hypothetical protein